MADGVSPESTICCEAAPASGTGTTETSAFVYGCLGVAITSAAGAMSTIRPSYTTAMRAARTQASERSCVMNR